jgi:filamentous hemagglutinin family protein
MRRTGISLAVASALCAGAPAQAQITTDGTLGAAQAFNGLNTTIPASLGRQAGGNLFHSFGQFNVPTGGSATFSGPDSVSNIISRVTGGQASLIDGLLRSTIANANLFLINPRGIVFGPGASLDLTGSFHASTAHYLKLADGTRFEATATPNPILTAAAPAAFGFLGPTGPVNVRQGSLQLAEPARSLSLVGGPVNVSGATLGTAAGDLQLVATAGPGEVTLAGAPTPGMALAPVTIQRSNLVAGSAFDAAAGTITPPGRILIRGGEMVIASSLVQSSNLSAAVAPPLEASAAGNLQVSSSVIEANAQDTGRGADIALAGENVTIDRATDVAAWSSWGGSGDIDISARGALRILATPADAPRYSRVLNLAYGPGPGGATRLGGDTVTVEASSVEHYTEGAGNAGPIALRGRVVELLTGAFVGNYNLPGSTGSGGSVDIAATERVRLAGVDWTGFRTNVLTQTYNAHDAGAIRLAAPVVELVNASIGSAGDLAGVGANGSITLAGSTRVTLTDQAFVGGATGNVRRGGDVRVDAGDVVLSAGGNLEANTRGTGRAGDVVVSATGNLVVSDGAGLENNTLGAGRAGDVVVRVAGDAVIDNGFVQSLAFAGGDAGRVDVQARGLAIVGDGRINSTTFADGASGEVAVRADRVALLAGGSITANSGFGIGAGGRVIVEATEEVVLSGGGLSAGTFGGGNGGNIEVKAPRLVVEGAEIAANTGGTGHAGNIVLDVGDLEVRGGSALTSGNGLTTGQVGTGNAGEIRIRASGSVLVTGRSFIETSTFSTGLGGHITVDAGELAIRDGGYLNSATAGAGPGGTITIRAGAVRLTDGGEGIFATAFDSGQGGRIQVTTPRLLIAGAAQIGANTAARGHAGSIVIDVGELELREEGAITSGNRLAAGPIGAGDSGEILIRATGDVRLADRSRIVTDTFSEGRGGRITLDARDVVLTGETGIAAATWSFGDGGAIAIRGRALRMSGGAQIVAGTFPSDVPGSGDGNAGSINVEVGRLELSGGAQIIGSSGTGSATAVAGGRGAAGDVNVVARESALLSGEGARGASGLYSQTYGPGRGGRIVLTTPVLVLDGGAAIDTSTAGAGDAGAITLNVGSASLHGAGTSINSGNVLFFRGNRFDGSGAGGLVGIAATGPLLLHDGAVISTRTVSDAPAGNVAIDAAAVELHGASSITSQSSGGGNAGSVSIHAGELLRIFHGSSITTAAERSDGGNIDIRARELVHLKASEITTSVGSGAGAGGNIFIDPTFVILQDGSRIVANAFGGPGGNIRIFALYFLNTLDTLVDASSQLGVPGTVSISAPNTNQSAQIKVLPAAFFDASALVREACSGRYAAGAPRSSLVGVGRGGLAASPERFAASTYFEAAPAASTAGAAGIGLRVSAASRARLASGCAG